MKILYVGDVMGELGMQVIERVLPNLRREHSLDAVIAQLENLSDGKGIKPADFARMQKAGVDFGTGGNWSLHLPETNGLLSDPNVPLIRPANYPDGTPGRGYKYLPVKGGQILVISLLGQIVGRDADKPIDNPLKVVDSILAKEAEVTKLATVVNLHGDFSSEKYVIGHYLDSRASLVVGDHWHTPTADTQILAGGTAHQTDVGMCGSLDSCLGIKFDVIEKRWLDGKPSRNIMEDSGRLQFNGVIVEVDSNGRAVGVERIRQIFNS